VAGRFAAKEAFAKALGTGIGEVAWNEIEILGDEQDAPTLKLYGAAEKKSQRTWPFNLVIEHKSQSEPGGGLCSSSRLNKILRNQHAGGFASFERFVHAPGIQRQGSVFVLNADPKMTR